MVRRQTSRRDFIKTTALALPVIASGCHSLQNGSGSASKSVSEFVVVRDGQFELRERPYRFIGANLWYGCYLADPKLEGGRERMIRELDRLKAIGVTNIRLLAGSETSRLLGAVPRGITIIPPVLDEDLLAGLDFCLAEMAKRDMCGVLFLSNYWQWSGGFAQYVRWATGESIPDPDWPQTGEGDWSGFMKFSARLYTVPAANDLFLNYVAGLLLRRNTINGRIYRDDPAIMTWELANEPRPGESAVPAFCDWVDATARFIHKSDPNHLVCTGSEGIRGCLDRAQNFMAAHKTPAIDYVTVHVWLKNWGWLKTPGLTPEYEAAVIRAKDHIEQHNILATSMLRKPLVLEEFGLPRDNEKYDPASPTTARDDYFRRMFDQVVESCNARRALQGANFWAWAGEGRAVGEMKSAAGLMGDPFSEPQGLNSVFDTDKATLDIIAQANEKLAVFDKEI